MKKFLLTFVSFLIFFTGFSQNNTTKTNAPEYVTNPTIPDFTLYKAPDSTTLTKEDLRKREPTLLMIFSPECGHCQNVTTDILKNFDHFKNAQILMVTWLPYSEMMSFYHNFKIGEHPQITMAWDKKDFFLPYYKVEMYPKLVVYNKKGQYVDSFSGDVKLEDVWKALDN